MKIKPTRKNCIDYLYLIAMHFNYEFVRHPDFERFKMYAEVAEESIELLKEQEAVEPKTGHWIESKCLDECFWVCSECNFPSEAIVAPKLYKYCPNCGIKMDGQVMK